MKRIRNETYSGNKGNTITTIQNGTAKVIIIQSTELLLNENYNKKL